jgi:hypothetical protein
MYMSRCLELRHVLFLTLFTFVRTLYCDWMFRLVTCLSKLLKFNTSIVQFCRGRGSPWGSGVKKIPHGFWVRGQFLSKVLDGDPVGSSIPNGFGSGEKLSPRWGTGSGRSTFSLNGDGFGKSFPTGKIMAAIFGRR